MGELGTVPPRRPLSRAGRGLLFAAPVLWLAAGYGGAFSAATNATAERPRAFQRSENEDPSADGAALYARHCSYCHGERGDGRGPAMLEPKARYFGAEKYKFGTTANAVPTDGDLLGVLHRGIPGSAMPSFGHLGEGEQIALVAHVRQLTRAGAFEQLRRKAEKDDEDFNPALAARRAAEVTEPGKPLDIPAEFPAATPEGVERGRVHFQKTCAACHGALGKGDGPQVKDMKNEDGTPNRPRDLTRGVFKGGSEPRHLYARIMLGIPGTPMPASSATLKPHEVQELIGFIYSLSGKAPGT